MSLQLTGSEPDDNVPDSFSIYLNAMNAEIIVSVPSYMEIPYGEPDEVFDTAAGVLIAPLKDIIEDYANDCISEDGGDGLLNMAAFFEQAAAQLRTFHASLDPDDIAAAKIAIKLVLPGDAVEVE